MFASMSNSDAMNSELHSPSFSIFCNIFRSLEVDGAGRDMSQEPESIQALSQSIHASETAKKKSSRQREWQMFSDVNVYQYSVQIICFVTGSIAEGER